MHGNQKLLFGYGLFVCIYMMSYEKKVAFELPYGKAMIY
jgi:hypothetical protein